MFICERVACTLPMCYESLIISPLMNARHPTLEVQRNHAAPNTSTAYSRVYLLRHDLSLFEAYIWCTRGHRGQQAIDRICN